MHWDVVSNNKIKFSDGYSLATKNLDFCANKPYNLNCR